MAIVKMKKMILAAPQDERNDILNLLQAKGSVELIDLKEEFADIEGLKYFKESESIIQAEANYNRIKFTLDFLGQYQTRKKGLLTKRDIITRREFDILGEGIDWEGLHTECRDIEEALNQNKNRKSKATSLIGQYKVWSDLDVGDSELGLLKRATYFIGTITKKYEGQVSEDLTSEFPDAYIEKISGAKQELNLFILCHGEDSEGVSEVLKKYGFTKANLDLRVKPTEQIEQLDSEIRELDAENEELVNRAKKLTENLSSIEKVYDYMASILEKESAVQRLASTRKTFVMQAWVPGDKVKGIEELLNKNFSDAFVDFEDPSEDDVPPIVLKNNALNEPFEAITSMYALPQHTEVDPTPALAPFYMIFFGMMAGDIGYGLVLLTVTAFALKFMDIEGTSRKIVKLLMYSSIPTIIFGWLYGGFFGDAIRIKPLWLNPVDDPLAVLTVSIAIGIVHLFTGLGVKAYWFIKQGKILDAVYDVLSWYILLSGLMWLLLGGGSIAKYMAIIGALGILLTQGRANKGFVGKFFGGVYGLYGITSYIGDILSYSRLLALGLATGLIGSSFNLLIRLLGNGAIAVVFGALIFVAGHTFNLLIGMLGTFVHACRLEYLEFFGKFYEGGGRAFDPLKISSKFVKVNTEN